MCRGGGGLGATSPQKPACKNCAFLCSFRLRPLTGHFVIFCKPVCCLCVSLPISSYWNPHWPFQSSFIPFSPAKPANLTHSFLQLEFLQLRHQTNSNILADRRVVIGVRKSRLPPIHPPMHVQNSCRYNKQTSILGTLCLVLFSVRGSRKISCEHLECQTI